MNSPVRLGVSTTAVSTPTGVFNQWFEALFPCTGTLGCLVFCQVCQLLPCQQLQPCPAYSTIPHLTGFSSHRLASSQSSPPDCCVHPSQHSSSSKKKNVSSLTPWLSEFHTVQFSVSSGCFLFLNCCCPFGNSISFNHPWVCSVTLTHSRCRMMLKEG